MRQSTIFSILAVVLMALALFVLPRLSGWSGWPILLLALVGILFYFLILWHSRTVGYLCPSCKHTFAISPWADFLSPHYVGKLLRCPRCGEVSWCLEISRVEVLQSEADPMPLKIALPPAGSLYLQIALAIVAYAALWLYTLKNMPQNFGANSGAAIFRIPIAAVLLVVLHFLFCHFAARHGYRSRIYPIMTIFVLMFLGLTFWMQYLNLAHLAR
jgi:hypothetical protein